MRHIQPKALCLLPMLVTLAACQTTDLFGPEPTTRQVETYQTETVFTEDGPVTTTTRTVRTEDIPRVPEQDIEGFWSLNVTGAEACLVELRINGVDGTNYRQAAATDLCPAGFGNIRLWRLDGEIIELRDASQKILARFERVGSRVTFIGRFIDIDNVERSATFTKAA